MRYLSGLSILLPCLFLGISGCNQDSASTAANEPMISYKVMMDSIHTALSADRRAYEDLIFDRLGRKQRVLRPSINWHEEKTIPFPSQMFTEGARIAQENGAAFSYVILSRYPLNRQNKPVTEVEKSALDFIYTHPGDNYYGEENIDGIRYYVAAYPENAYMRPCMTCHNTHQNATKQDYQVGDIIGAILIRYPLES